MSKKKNTLVFLDVSVNGDPLERITIEVNLKPVISCLSHTLQHYFMLEVVNVLLALTPN